MGGPAAAENNFWQLFVRPGGHQPLVPGHPGGRGRQRRAGRGQRRGRRLAPGRVPAQPGPDLLSRWPPAPTRARTGRRACSTPTWPTSRTRWPSPRRGGPWPCCATAASRRRPPSGAATAGQWSPLTSLSALAATAPGRGCGLVAVNAVTFGPDNVPMAAGSCVRRGVAGVFADTGGAWQAAGPVLPAGFGGDQVQVLGLAATADGNAALLLAGSGLLAAWSAGGRWTVSGPLARSRRPEMSGRARVGVRAGRERLGAARRGARGDDQRARIRLADAAGPAGGYCDAGAGARSRYAMTRWRCRGRASPSGGWPGRPGPRCR